MAELVDAIDLKSISLQSGGSTPSMDIESVVEWLLRTIVNRIRKYRVFESHPTQIIFFLLFVFIKIFF